MYRRFKPTRFDAEEWVGIARDAGMKYLVNTAKGAKIFVLFHPKQLRVPCALALKIQATEFRELRQSCGEFYSSN